MKKVFVTEINLNDLSAELNNFQLISDDTHFYSARAEDLADKCDALLSELQVKGLGDHFMDLLDCFPNTKVIIERLMRSTRRIVTDSENHANSQSFNSQNSFEMPSKGHISRKLKTAEPSCDTPTMVSSDLVSGGGASASQGSNSNSKVKNSNTVTQNVGSTDSNFDSLYLPRTCPCTSDSKVSHVALFYEVYDSDE